MERTGSCNIQLQTTRASYLLLFTILLTLDACSFPAQPRYQPLSQNSALSRPAQGYQDIQIDGETYLIAYMNYFSLSPNHGLLIDPLDDKWLQGAQEYVLYRSGELVKSKGAKYFVVLHKDDWNVTGLTRHKYGLHPIVQPGAALMIRVLSEYPSPIPQNDDRVYEVDKLLKDLPEKNSGLAEYQKKTTQAESMKKTETRFSRWRSSVNGYDSASVPGSNRRTIFGSEYIKFESGSKSVPQTQSGHFEFAIWDDRLISPLRFLSECMALANQEGYAAFRLVDWTVEEHRTDGSRGNWKVWFKAKANVVLLHQKERDSLDPIFVVNEIRSNVMNDTVRLESW